MKEYQGGATGAFRKWRCSHYSYDLAQAQIKWQLIMAEMS